MLARALQALVGVCGGLTVFLTFLYALRTGGLKVGTGEWLVLLQALQTGIITDLDELYRVGRAILCRGEADFDTYDQAFGSAFEGLSLPEGLADRLAEWLENAALSSGVDQPPPDPRSVEELWRALLETLREQEERHDGGNRWVGTGGTSPFGHSGRAARGIRVGGAGRGRRAVGTALERRWAGYRTDRVLGIRELEVALRSLRNLTREGTWELDLNQTIHQTCENAGDIQIVERRARENQVHLVLLMDAGGSMAPHYERVSNLFTAADRVKTFRSFRAYTFHNCVYANLWDDSGDGGRVPTAELLASLGPRHRLVLVGDASMAPYELFSPVGWPLGEAVEGLEWLRRLRRRCPASVWLNPDPERFWNHPTVRAIGTVFPMFSLTLDGLRTAVKKLRAPV